MQRKIALYMLVALVTALFLPLAAAAQDEPRLGNLAQRTAEDYRKAARYPAWSKVLTAGAPDPLREKRVPTRITTAGPEGEGPALTVWSHKIGFVHPEPARIYASIEGNAPVVITGDVVRHGGEVVATLRFFDDGSAPDKAAGDGVYTATMAFGKNLRPALADQYMVRVQATLDNGEPRFATGGFLYSRPHATLTGRYRDAIRDGNLVVQAQVRVTEAGRFHLAGALHSMKGEPIGTAQTALELEPGRHWIDLEFYGLMFHDRQVRGPFRVGTLELRTVGAMPNALNDLVLDAHITRTGGNAKALNARPFNDPELLEAVRRLELEAVRFEASRE